MENNAHTPPRLDSYVDEKREFTYRLLTTTDQNARKELLQQFMQKWAHDHRVRWTSDQSAFMPYIRFIAERDDKEIETLHMPLSVRDHFMSHIEELNQLYVKLK
jgi:hypothetical protein